MQAWEAFVAVRDDARRALEAAVGSAASAFQQRLAADDAGCGEDLAALDDDRVMRLTEQEVHQVGKRHTTWPVSCWWVCCGL